MFTVSDKKNVCVHYATPVIFSLSHDGVPEIKIIIIDVVIANHFRIFLILIFM